MNKIVIIVIIFITILTFTISYFYQTLPDNKFHIYYLNVGQGSTTLIITPQNHRILIDGGPSTQILSQLANLVPFYDRRIDLIIPTHPHTDHIFGFIPILERYRVAYTINSGIKTNSQFFVQYLQNHKKHQTKFLIASPEHDFLLGDTQIDILSPNYFFKKIEPDDSSLMFKFTYHNQSLLFTGDAPKTKENWLIENYPTQKLKTDIILVGHHGSKSSTSPQFIKTISPKIAVISYGKDNKFGHPSPQTLETLESNHIKVLGTAKDGTIHFTF